MKRSTIDALIIAGIVLALAAGGVYCCVVWGVQVETRIVNGATG